MIIAWGLPCALLVSKGTFRRPKLVLRFFVLACATASVACSSYEPTRGQRRGGQLYHRMCAVCHGPTGAGYRADQAPAVTHPEFLGSVSNDFLRRAIAGGRSGTTMSAWASERGGPLAAADVDALITFMRAWQRRARPTLDEGAPAGDAVRGNEIYARECARCHGPRGTGGPYVNIGEPGLLSTASNGFLRHAIRHGRPGTPMEGFAPSLGDTAIEDILAFMRTWQPPPSHTPPTPPSKALPLTLGPVPLNPQGPEPIGFKPHPATTKADVIKGQLDRHAKMALLDARAPSDYLNEHIAGAVSVPFYDPDPFLSALPKNAWLVCYCACPHAESGQLASKLTAAGFTKVTVLDEGLGFWRSRKYETH